MLPDILKRFPKKGQMAFLTSLVCFSYLLSFTWLKWGDPVMDMGREMYLPLQLLEGKVLYRDIFYPYGPFSPYFNALLFRAFGVHVMSLALGGIFTAIISAFLVYGISRISMEVFLSVFTVVTFLTVFAFGQYGYYGIFNFIIPYSYPAVHGVMFSLLALYLFYLLFERRSKAAYIFYAAGFIATFLCRIEIGVILALSVMTAVFVYAAASKKQFGETLRLISAYILLPVAPAILVYGIFFILSGHAAGKDSALSTLFLANVDTKNPFTAYLSGVDNLYGNFLKMLAAFCFYFIFYLLFLLGGFILNRARREKKALVRTVWYIITAGVFTAFYITLFRKLFPCISMQYRALPLVSLAVIAIAWRRLTKHISGKYAFLLALSIFSLLMMSRMLFNAWAGHYGFYILPPAVIVCYIFFLKIMPEALHSEYYKMAVKAGFVLLFMCFIASHFNISALCYKNRTLKVGSERGYLYFFPNGREKTCRNLIDFLKESAEKGESLVVFPEGELINFFSGLSNPLYYHNYLPLDLIKGGIEEKVIAEMESYRVSYVVILERDTSEYGYARFGRDYGEGIMRYIFANYDLYKQFGPYPFTKRGYGIALFKRKTRG